MPRHAASTSPAPDFEIHEQRDARGAVRLSLSGELDIAVAHLLRDHLQALAREHRTVTLDLSELQFLDSTGIQVLITSCNHAAQDGWVLHIDPELTRPVRRVIELVGIGHILWP